MLRGAVFPLMAVWGGCRGGSPVYDNGLSFPLHTSAVCCPRGVPCLPALAEASHSLPDHAAGRDAPHCR